MATRVAKPVSDRQDSRKRVFKACERCRMKKIKCEGVSPCQRCLAEDGICVFGRRRQGLTRMVTSGYVENLEMQQRVLTKALKAAWRSGNPDKPANLPVHAILEDLGLLHGIGGPDSLRASFEILDKQDDSDEGYSPTHGQHEHDENALDESSCCEQPEDFETDHVQPQELGKNDNAGSNDISQQQSTSQNRNSYREGRMRSVFGNLGSETPPLSWRDSSSTISTVPSIPSPMSAGGKRSDSIPTSRPPVDSIAAQSSPRRTPTIDSANLPRRRSSQRPTFCPMPPKPVFPPQLQPVSQPLPLPPVSSIAPSVVPSTCVSFNELSFSTEELDQIVKQEVSTAEWAQQWNMGCQDTDSLMAEWLPSGMDLDLDLNLDDSYQRKTFTNWVGAL